MATKRTKVSTPVASDNAEIKRGRLRKLKVKNFRSIGDNGVEVELDDIVVLVGPNNAGKSSILRAYEIIMLDGSKEGHLKIDDFPNRDQGAGVSVEIELETEVVEGEPGIEWLGDGEGKPWPQKSSGPKIVREKWVWTTPGLGKRSGWNTITQTWDERVPWGAANVANARRPEPHPVRAFDTPEDQAKQIHDLLKTALIAQAKDVKDDSGNSIYDKILNDIKIFQEKILDATSGTISNFERRLNDIIADIFVNHVVLFKQPTDHNEKSISLFPVSGQLTVGPEGGHIGPLELQGSGMRRTMLWAALRIISEEKQKSQRPHVLLIDEPELCLHPSAIRDACRVLYNIAGKDNWQVMVTTHSPIFIDLSRNNSSIVRVERLNDGRVSGTTLYRPTRARLDEDDRANLKLLNIYDPYVAEFFFGGKIVVVEGDTEYSAFRYVIDEFPDDFGSVHVIRARGKATIASIAKILNQFSSPYSIIHDSDVPKCERKDKKTGVVSTINNPAWTNNQKIMDEVSGAIADHRVRIVASRVNFEEAFFDVSLSGEKPYSAVQGMKANPEVKDKIKTLLQALVDQSKPVPEEVLEWKTLSDLEKFVSE